MRRTHWSKLRPIVGYTRIPDREYPNGNYQRMMRCDVDRAEIPTLARHYHERGRVHRDAADR